MRYMQLRNDMAGQNPDNDKSEDARLFEKAEDHGDDCGRGDEYSDLYYDIAGTDVLRRVGELRLQRPAASCR